jgi:hypothetical protein
LYLGKRASGLIVSQPETMTGRLPAFPFGTDVRTWVDRHRLPILDVSLDFIGSATTLELKRKALPHPDAAPVNDLESAPTV